MRSLTLLALLIAACAITTHAVTVDVYTSEGLSPGWTDTSWNGLFDIHYRATPEPDSLQTIYSALAPYGAMSLRAPEPMTAASVSFYINIIPGGDPSALELRLDTDKGEFRAQSGLPLNQDAMSGEWQLVVMPLSKLSNQTEPWDRISIQDISGNGASFFITELVLDVGPEAQSFSPFTTALPPVWPLRTSPFLNSDAFVNFNAPAPMTLYENGQMGLGVASWSWKGDFNYSAPSPTAGPGRQVAQAVLGQGGGLSFTTDAPFDRMNNIIFWIYTESTPMLNIRLEASAPMNLLAYEAPLSIFAPQMLPGAWNMVSVPVPQLGLPWDRFSIVEASDSGNGRMESNTEIFVDALTIHPTVDIRAWDRVFAIDENGTVPLYIHSLMPGVQDWSWDVNSDFEFFLPGGPVVIRATTAPFGAVSLKTQSPFAGFSALEFDLWLTTPIADHYVPEVAAFGNNSFPDPMDDPAQYGSSISIRLDATTPTSDGAGSGNMYVTFPLSSVSPNVEGGKWQRITIPLGDTDPEHAWDRVSFMDATGMGISFFLDNIILKAGQGLGI